jgi:hypothetical protein
MFRGSCSTINGGDRGSFRGVAAINDRLLFRRKIIASVFARLGLLFLIRIFSGILIDMLHDEIANKSLN